MLNSKAKELIRAEQLIEEGKFEEALRLLNEFGEKINPSFHDKISYYILRSSLASYFYQGNLI